MAPQNSSASLKNARIYRPTPACTDVLQRSGLRGAAGCRNGVLRPQKGAAASARAARSLRQGDAGSWPPVALSALRDNGGVDAAAHIEARTQTQEARVQRAIEMIGDLVGDRFVEGAAIAERPDIKLERFELDAQLVGHVFEIERREIRLPGARAQAGEFRNLHANRVVGASVRIGKSLELVCGRVRHIALHYTNPRQARTTAEITRCG